MPINKYVLNYETTTRNVDGDSTTYTIKNLERNTRYSIEVRATNKAEWGDMSVVETKTTQFCKENSIIVTSTNLQNFATSGQSFTPQHQYACSP